ncbi:hypothetical protein J2T09_000911 [Neorhizobium huautlense]|uniref:DNA mimic protein DMP19 C-terminal domain-containing protein n=1 Tax=Neorhizobium huautlense TaxID=67774 RepID=A0ABT9PR33_9HYPH|nr:DUF4375 domain-containing protein [Neorhizobium huautlense]MDP9836169.1 hypothetical protein [Neorhizobium huautlense]
MAAALADEERKACDLEGLKRYPMSFAIAQHAIPIGLPDIFFRDREVTPTPDEFTFEYVKSEEAAVKRRQALTRGLATFPEIQRPILMLVAGSQWTSKPGGLKAFFVSRNSIHVDELLAVLDAEGLNQHAALLREGKAYFGPDYGTELQRYRRWNRGKGDLDKDFERYFKELDARFRQLPRLLDEAVKRIEASPELTAIYEPIRANMPEETRFRRLSGGIFACVDPYDDVDAVLSRLVALPKPYSQIMVVKYFQDEMLNGSVHQAFFNSSGNFMPQVEAALTGWGLTKHAEAVRKGIAMFPTPYPRDIEERRNFMATKGEDFDAALYELTGPVDDGAMSEAMIRIARENDILPK